MSISGRSTYCWRFLNRARQSGNKRWSGWPSAAVLSDRVNELIIDGPDRIVLGRKPVTPSVKHAIGRAMEESREMHDDHVCSGHVLLGLMADHETVAGRILQQAALTAENVRDQVRKITAEPTYREHLLHSWSAQKRRSTRIALGCLLIAIVGIATAIYLLVFGGS